MKFSADVTDYTATVGNAVAMTTVTATVAVAGASVKIEPEDADATASNGDQVELEVGENPITVTVTPVDVTSATKVYEVVVTRRAPSSTIGRHGHGRRRRRDQWCDDHGGREGSAQRDGIGGHQSAQDCQRRRPTRRKWSPRSRRGQGEGVEGPGTPSHRLSAGCRARRQFRDHGNRLHRRHERHDHG